MDLITIFMSKKNIILIIIFLALLGLAYFCQYTWQNWKTKITQPVNFLTGVDYDKLDKIEIKQADKKVVLQKQTKSDKWVVASDKNQAVDKTVFNSLIDGLKRASVDNLSVVSENKLKKAEFGANGNGIVLILFKDNISILDFVIGKNSYSYGTYLTRDGLDKTFEIGTDLRSLVEKVEWIRVK